MEGAVIDKDDEAKAPQRLHRRLAIRLPVFKGRLHGRLFLAFLVLVMVVLLLSGFLVNRVVTDYIQQGNRAEFDQRVMRVFVELRNFDSVDAVRSQLPALSRLAGVKLTLVTDQQQLDALLKGRGEWEWQYYWPNTFIPRFRFFSQNQDTRQKLQEIIPLAPNGELVGVLIVEPSDQAAPARQDLLRLLALVGLIGLGLAALLAWLLSVSLTRPISQLQTAAELAAEGDWSEAESILPDERKDELGTLAREFKRMGSELQQTMDLLRHERDQLRGFIGDLSHEIKTPLTSMQTFSDLLLEGAVDEPEVRKEFLEQLQVQVRRLKRLTENLLELSKLDSGLVELDREPVDLRETVAGAVGRNRTWATRKSQGVVVSMPEYPVVVMHDPFHTGRLLDNLISNAIKYTPDEGDIHLELGVTDDGHWAELRVWDSGPGIPQDDVAHLFDRFYRARGHKQDRREPGTGLGLAITRALVEAHGGRIAVTNPERAEFTVWLPTVESE